MIGTETVPFPRAMERFPTLRQSLLGAADLCMLEARLAYELEYDAPPEDAARVQWSTHPQGGGQIFHRWAHRLLDTLSVLDQDALADTVECKSCGARPNDDREPDDASGDYQEGNSCPACGTALVRVPLTEEALDLLVECLRQHDVAAEDVVRVPQHLARDLEWIVVKFAREQRFQIANYVAAEERMEATLEYPNPAGGVVTRTMTGKPDAIFAEQEEDGSLHVFVLDWKSGWGIPGVTTISKEGYWQQRFYAWLVMKSNPSVSRVTLREVYVRYRGGDKGADNHRQATIYRDKLPIIERQLSVVAESFDRAMEAWLDYRAMAAEHGDDPPEDVREHLAVLQRRVRALFAPTPGGHCNYCPLPHRCPIVDDVRVHGTVRTFEDAKRVANELAVITRAKKHREEALRGYLEHAARTPTDRHAPVTVATADDQVKLRKYTDKPPGLPEGVPLATAKGKRSYALVEGTRRSKPDRETYEELLEAARAGRKVDLDAYFGESSSTTMRLVEPAVPTDEAAALSPEVEESLRRSMERLERARRAS